MHKQSSSTFEILDIMMGNWVALVRQTTEHETQVLSSFCHTRGGVCHTRGGGCHTTVGAKSCSCINSRVLAS